MFLGAGMVPPLAGADLCRDAVHWLHGAESEPSNIVLYPKV